MHEKLLVPTTDRFREILTVLERICPAAADRAREKGFVVDHKGRSVEMIADYEVRRFVSLNAGLADEGFVDDLFFRNYDDLSVTEQKMREDYMKHFGVVSLMSSNPLLS